MSEIKVYNAFNAVSDSNPNMEKEKFTKESLVDPLEKVPTLQEYVKRYLVTGDPRVLPYSDEPIDEIPEEEADDDFSSPLYDKDADLDDYLEASKVDGVASVKDAYALAKKVEETKKSLDKKISTGEKFTDDEVALARKIIEEKKSKETTKKSEKIEVAQDDGNNHKETID